MTPDEGRDEVLADLTAARAADPDMRPPAGVDAGVWEEAGRLAVVADLLWDRAHGAPPLSEDPVAAMLGLVPDLQFSLDGRALARARKTARMQVGDLAGALRSRGWEVTTQDVFRWETRPCDDVSPALIAAIAAELGTTPERLSADRSGASGSPLEAVTRTPRFAQLAARLARIQNVPVSLAASTLRARGLATVHRGGEPDPGRWLDSLEAFVAALEDRDER